MSTITLEYPTSWLAALGTTPPKFAAEAKLAAAMKLYEQGRLSSGQAAQLAGIPRSRFLLTCPDWGVNSVERDDDDLAAEFSTPTPVDKHSR